MMHQSNPGVRRLRVSQPSIHFPRSVYLPSMKTGASGFNKFSFGAKNSSLANSTAPPSRSEARSISSVKSIRTWATKRHKKHKRKSYSCISAENVLLDLESSKELVNLEAGLSNYVTESVDIGRTPSI